MALHHGAQLDAGPHTHIGEAKATRSAGQPVSEKEDQPCKQDQRRAEETTGSSRQSGCVVVEAGLLTVVRSSSVSGSGCAGFSGKRVLATDCSTHTTVSTPGSGASPAPRSVLLPPSLAVVLRAAAALDVDDQDVLLVVRRLESSPAHTDRREQQRGGPVS